MTDKNKHIPQGYKDSPLGIIPKEWEVKRLGDFCISFSGGTPRSGTPSYYNGTIPFIRSGEINQDKTELFLSQEGLENSSAKFVQKGDILYALYGANSGQCSLSKINGVINQAILCIRPNAHPYFLMSVLQFNKNHYYNSYLQGGQGNLSGEIVSNYKIALPSTEEQERICSVLLLWDTAIEKQSELIEKFKLRKRALMQQLLTGKKRLPGFRGEWKEVKLGDVSNFLRNNTLSREQLNDDDGVINNIHYGDVLIKYPSIIDCRKEKLQYINDGVSILTDYVENGDVIMSDTAEDETVGRVCEVQNVGNKKILAGLHTMLIRPHDKLFAPYFLGYYLNSEAYHKQLIPLIQGIKVCSIGKVAVQNTVLTIPSLEEQRIIASVLVKADKEIELANEKLASLQSQKRGLMQQLLTGKKRIKG